MVQWEYITILDDSMLGHKNTNEFTRKLNAAGWEGWELVSVANMPLPLGAAQRMFAILKRPLTEDRKNELLAK